MKKSFISLCHGGYRQPRPAGCARRPQARAPAHPLRHERTGHDARTSPSARAPASWATCWANTTPTATAPSTTRWCAWRRTSTSAIPLVEGQGNFGSVDGDGAAAMRYTEARMSKLTHAPDAARSTRTPWTSTPTSTKRCMQPAVHAQPLTPTCWSTAPAASPWAWPPTSPRTTCGEVVDGVRSHDRPSRLHHRGPDAVHQGAGLPHRRHHSGPAAASAPPITTGRGRILVRAKTEIEAMSQQPQPHRGDGNPLHGQQGQAGGEDRRAGA